MQESTIVRKLAARKKIQELEENVLSLSKFSDDEHDIKDEIKKTIIQLGLENNLTSQYTSFVGIDNTTGDPLSDRPMCTREIKNQVASGFAGMGIRAASHAKMLCSATISSRPFERRSRGFVPGFCKGSSSSAFDIRGSNSPKFAIGKNEKYKTRLL